MVFPKIKEYTLKFGWEIIDLIFPSEETVARLEKTSPSDLAGMIPFCIESPLPYARAIFDYKNPDAKKIVWEIKYGGNRRLAKLAAMILSDEIIYDLSEKTQFEDFKNPILIPIPISSARRKKRGFNQCELLAKYLPCLASFDYQKKILLKRHEIKHQTKTRDKAERQKNLRGSFMVRDASAVSDKNIILLDDVITTGSTIEEAAKTLYRAGAKRVIAFALAH